jgi:hypothetical protein
MRIHAVRADQPDLDLGDVVVAALATLDGRRPAVDTVGVLQA